MVYHYYLQVHEAEEIIDSDIGVDPNGNSADIGHELDLIIGGKLNKYMKISITGGIFFPGKVFEENDYAYFGELELQLSFK